MFVLSKKRLNFLWKKYRKLERSLYELVLPTVLIGPDFLSIKQVTIYMGEGWYFDFRHTHFDTYSPPDFYARVRFTFSDLQHLNNLCNITL